MKWFCVLVLVLSGFCAAGAHDHFDSEVSRLSGDGLILSREYRSDASNSEAAGDFFALNGVSGLAKCNFGDTCAHYDSDIDGFVLAITSGVFEANSLQARFGPVGGEVWTQWEMWVDQDFVDDLPVEGIWKNTKLFRFYNNDEAGVSQCPHEKMDTLFIYWDEWQDKKGFWWEDTIEKNSPAEDCKGSILEDPNHFGNEGNQWMRHTMYYNFNTKRVAWWVTDPVTGATEKRADEIRSNWLSNEVDGVGPMLHMSKRDDDPLPGHETYTFGYRNMIVSSEEISFDSGVVEPECSVSSECSSGEVCVDGVCVEEVCVPDWSCGGWGACIDGERTRVCSDSNSCGNLGGKPDEEESCSVTASGQLPAFPGAEGFGANTVGGREGEVWVVSNLNDYGEGSFREAVIVPPRNYGTGVIAWESKTEYEQRVLEGNQRERHYATAPYIWESEVEYIERLENSGKKIIVFNVSGIIDLESDLIIRIPYLTIAGQTSPGGILIAGRPVMINNHDVIVQHIRFRVGSHRVIDSRDADFVDSLSIRGDGMYSIVPSYNVILDHCSFSWGVDETLSINENATNITVQNCIISEGLNDAGHSEGNHGYGLILWGRYNSDDVKVSVHHNYFAHNTGRNPEMNYRGFLDLRNNVVYNTFGGQSLSIQGNCTTNAVHNYVKAGPSTAATQIPFLVYADETNECPGNQIYVEGNIGNLRTSQNEDNWISAYWSMYTPWTYGPLNSECRQLVEFDAAPVNFVEANYENALNILEDIGATRPFRDSVDERVLADFEDGTGSLIDNIIFPDDYPTFQNLPAPADVDSDGMSDLWEAEEGFNVGVDDSALDADSDGYTNIEEYLHYLSGNEVVVVGPVCAHDADKVPCDNDVSLGELEDYLGEWLRGEVSLGDVLGAIGEWRR